MLPIVDYGSVAIVIPQIAAVGHLINEKSNFGVEIFLSGIQSPIVVAFDSLEDSTNARDELVTLIAQYYYAKEFGPDFEFDEIIDNSDDDNDVNEH